MENYIIQSHKISYNLIHFQTVSYNLIHFDTISYNFVQFHTISYIFIQSHTSSSNLIQSETILCFSNNNMENTGPGYGTDINVPVYATVKGVSIDILIFKFFVSFDLMIDKNICQRGQY